MVFALLRGRSAFLAIEQDPAPRRALAAQHGVPLADVFALRELLGADAPAPALAACVAVYAAQRSRTGDPLAAMLAIGADPATTRAIEVALETADGPTAAWRQFAVTGSALPGLRFVEVRRRFAERAAARD